MATQMPMQPSQPGAAPGQEEQGEPTGGVEFCIRLAADGTLSYYTERDGQPEGEQPAQSIGEAMKMLLDAYKAVDPGTTEQAGYDSVPPPAAPRMPQRPQPFGTRRGV